MTLDRVGRLFRIAWLTAIAFAIAQASTVGRASEPVDFGDVRTLIDADGTEIWCVYDVTGDEEQGYELYWTDCPGAEALT